jgi:hypothetical protein
MGRSQILSFFLTFSLFFTVGCGGAKEATEASSTTPGPAKVPDFEHTQIETTGAAPADGESKLIVTVHLKNSDDSPVVGFRPSFSVSLGTGLNAATCSASTSSGDSTCSVTSSDPGVKTIQLTNARRGLTVALNFRTPAGEERAGLAAGALIQGRTTDGYQVRAMVGGSFQRYNPVTYDNYKIKLFTADIGTK